MNLVAFDTATPATVAAAAREDALAQARHDPAAGERPGHGPRLLALVERALADAGLEWAEVERLGVGVGPGSFTGLRIGIATARALAQGRDLPVAGVSTLRALALGAVGEAGGAPVLAVVDARRGEVFAAAWRGEEPVLETSVLGPEALAARVSELSAPPLAVGDGAVRFAAQIQAAGAAVPPADSPLHRVAGAPLCRLTAEAEPADRDAVLPDYQRLPDAEIARRARK